MRFRPAGSLDGLPCLFCRKRSPEFIWWPKFRVRPYPVIYNVASLRFPDGTSEMFVLDLLGGPRNRRKINLPVIVVREELFLDEHETLADYVRRKAAEYRTRDAA